MSHDAIEGYPEGSSENPVQLNVHNGQYYMAADQLRQILASHDSSIIHFAPPQPETYNFADGRIMYDKLTKTAIVDGEAVHFTPRQDAVLRALGSRLNLFVTSSELIDQVWGQQHIKYGSPRIVSTNIGEIRKKVGEELGDPENGFIVSFYKRGYMARSSLLT